MAKVQKINQDSEDTLDQSEEKTETEAVESKGQETSHEESTEIEDVVTGSGKDSSTTSKRRYSSDEVADIIRLSLQEEARGDDDSIDYAELIAIGKDVGVTDKQIEQAIHLLEEQQQTTDKEKLLWIKFKAHGVIFIATNMLLITLNLIIGADSFWSGYVLLGWGLFLLGHYAGLRYAPEFVEMAMERTRVLAANSFESYLEDDENVEFSVTDSSGLMESEGLVFIRDDKLVIEHQTADSVLGILKSTVKETVIPISEIARAKIEQKFWSSELVLHSRSLKTFRHLPGHSSGSVRLKIKRQSSAAAQTIASQISARNKA